MVRSVEVVSTCLESPEGGKALSLRAVRHGSVLLVMVLMIKWRRMWRRMWRMMWMIMLMIMLMMVLNVLMTMLPMGRHDGGSVLKTRKLIQLYKVLKWAHSQF